MYFSKHLLAVIVVSCFRRCESEKVTTKLGVIIGSTYKTTIKDVEYRVNTYFGIPYAKPPVGELRFQRPELLSQLESPFEALSFGSACPQTDSPGIPVYNKSEDCLYLNVYVPSQKPDKDTGHAVMVFMHGGGLSVGASHSWPCEFLSAYGNVILVTINYRLGVFGFMDTQDGKIPGNLGFHDQHLALKWVNKNIGDFGGDKDRVTIFGQSAGGSSVVLQGLYPQNKGLIHRVISESGVPTSKSLIKENPRDDFLVLAKELGCDTTSTENAITCIKLLDTETIMKKLEQMSTDPEKMMAAIFYSTLDGEIIKTAPHLISSLAKTKELEEVKFFRSLDFLSGFTNQEGGVFLLTPIYPLEDLDSFTLSREDFMENMVPSVLSMAAGLSSDVIKPLVITEYTNWTDPYLPENNRDQYVKLLSDVYFTVGSVEMSRLHSSGTGNPKNTYAYYFTAKPSNRALISPKWLKGANHGDELFYVFGPSQKFLDAIIVDREIKPTEDWEFELSYSMITYWTNFAKTG